MAVTKKAATKKSSASATKKAAPKKAAAKKTATKTAKAPKKGVSAATASKSGTPKASATKKAAPKKSAVQAVKLTDKQLDLLKAVQGTRESGYLADKKAETKTLDSLAGKKLIKKGAKDKTSGHVRYHVSKTGEKHIASQSATV